MAGFSGCPPAVIHMVIHRVCG